MEVHVDASEVHQLAADMERNADELEPRMQQVIVKGGHDTQATAQLEAPVLTGHLRGSISTTFGDLWFESGPTAEYGGYVEEGVPHPVTITAKDGGFLRFVVDGRVVFARTVTRGPQAPQPYMAPAADQHFPLIERAGAALAAGVISRG